MRRTHWLILAAGLGAILVPALAALFVFPSTVWPDRPIPSRFAPYVDSARASIRSNIEGIRIVHLRLDSVRCRRDGAAAIIFEQREPPYLNTSYAYAISGTWPPVGWDGGVGIHDAAADPELAYFLGADEVPCS